MPDTSAVHGKSFDDNIEILFDELVLAEQWGRPSLLLAVHKSKIGQEKAERALEARLEAEGLAVVRIVFNDQRSDISQLVRAAQAPARAVYFVSNLDWGGGEEGRQAYRGLNLHRELFVDEAIKAVFWLSVNEAANLPRFAPDFWAFRHRVVEFVSQRAAGKVHLPAGILAWDMQATTSPFEDAAAAIEARQELLRRLPDTMEALSARVELHASLAHLQWSLGDLMRAQAELEAGMKTAAEHALPELKSSLLNGMGVILYEQDQRAEALERFTEGLRFRSSSRVLLINISATNCALGRVQEALSTGKKALRANSMEADTWRRLGYIQNAAGRPDEAIACVARAAELAPREPEHRVSLAVLYKLIDRPDDARIQMTRARELGTDDSGTLGAAVREAVLGDAAAARSLLSDGLASGKIRKREVRRDVNLALLFEEELLQEILARAGTADEP